MMSINLGHQMYKREDEYAHKIPTYLPEISKKLILHV